MLLWTILKVALRSLVTNKLRLALTMLGIIIGVGAVIAMLALGEGAQQSVLDRFRAMGTNLLILRPNWSHSGGVAQDQPQRLYIDDWKAIEAMDQYVAAAAPEAYERVQARRGNKNSRLMVLGTTPPYFFVRNFQLTSGRMFTEEELARHDNVCVIGSQVVTDLFEDADPIQQVIYLGSRRLTVIGVTAPKGDQGWFSPDNQVFAPLTTVMDEIIGQDYLDTINITCRNAAIIPEAKAAITDLMRRRHRLRPDQESDFRLDSQAELLGEVQKATDIFKLLLGGIAGVSLLVGGIGIMNIMLVTVTERTREIGVRKALGARQRDIMTQFLIESIVIACMGGGLGIGLGWGIAKVFNEFNQSFQTIITASSIILAVSCSSAIGLVFGLYPARRAARLDPIEALRHE
jgi:putative ABC transport system permease protein